MPHDFEEEKLGGANDEDDEELERELHVLIRMTVGEIFVRPDDNLVAAINLFVLAPS